MNKLEKAYTDNPIDRYNKLVKEQIMPACTFVNDRNDIFKDKHGAVVPMILEYSMSLEQTNKQQAERIESQLKTIQLLTEEIIRLKQ